MNPYTTPVIEPAASDAKCLAPPKFVRWAMACIALSILLGMAKMFYSRILQGYFLMDHPERALAFGFWMAILAGLIYPLLRGLHRGPKVALWIYLLPSIFVVLTIVSQLHRLAAFPHVWEKVVYFSQGLLQFTAAILLVMPQSWRWFYPKPGQGELIANRD